MVAQPPPPLMTVDEYLEMERASDDRHEYIDGRVTRMAGGTPSHGRLCLNIASILNFRLLGSRCRAYPSDVRAQLEHERYVYPDVSVSCDERDRNRAGRGHACVLPLISCSWQTEGEENMRSWY